MFKVLMAVMMVSGSDDSMVYTCMHSVCIVCGWHVQSANGGHDGEWE